MKRARRIFSLFLCFSLMFTFSGCKPNYDSLPDSYNNKTDYPYSFISTNEVAITPAENGYYYVEGNFLFF